MALCNQRLEHYHKGAEKFTPKNPTCTPVLNSTGIGQYHRIAPIPTAYLEWDLNPCLRVSLARKKMH